ncbi:hypothetical protein Leryth_002112 [Lithospermum erythrorhizon]|nr:hypothetical protein Leryth_002112 [Lithospermum erythrorhizon]
MVVIEPVPTSSLKQEEVRKKSPSPAITTADKLENINVSLSSTDAAVPSYNSDGYETASDSELNNENDNVEVSDANELKDNGNTGEANGENQNQVQAKDDENALAQVNDAKLDGNALFKEGKYEEALLKYELALQIASTIPSSVELRSMCYSNRGACFSKLEKHTETVKECTKALELSPSYTNSLIRRAEAHEKLENYEEAISDMKKVLELDPLNDQARRNIIRLKPLADEKREKMKDEMIGKLKEMGNSILGRFGMSVDNFKAVKDPNTGSYSVSFQK